MSTWIDPYAAEERAARALANDLIMARWLHEFRIPCCASCLAPLIMMAPLRVELVATKRLLREIYRFRAQRAHLRDVREAFLMPELRR